MVLRLWRRALVALALCAAARAAYAQENPDLERARSQIEAVRLKKARSSLERALVRGGNQPETLIEIYRLRGEVAVGLRDREAAREHFRALLALDPDAALGEMVSPKIQAQFEAAREELAGRSLDLSLEIVGEPTPGVALIVDDDPASMVASAEVTFQGAAQPVSATRPPEADRIIVALPESAREVEVTAFDAHGNRLRQLEIEDPAPSASMPADRSPGTPIYQHWALWAGVVGFFAVAGTVFGLDVDDAENDLEALVNQSDMHTYSEARKLESRGRRSALLANLSFAAAAAAALTGGLLVWKANKRREPKVAPALGPGAGLSVRLRF